MHGSGDVIAAVNGSYTLSYDETYGFNSALTSYISGKRSYSVLLRAHVRGKH